MVTSLSMLTNRLTFPHRLIIVMTAGPYLGDGSGFHLLFLQVPLPDQTGFLSLSLSLFQAKLSKVETLSEGEGAHDK